MADPVNEILPGDQFIFKGKRSDIVFRRIKTRSGKTLEREVVVHPGAVIILPVLEDGRIVLIKNFRHTVLQELYELPAGTLERGEDPAVCAGRELIEETGYESGDVRAFGWFYTSPGILTEKMYVFVAKKLTPGPQALEDTEDIVVEPMEPATVRAMILNNQIVDAKTIATLLKYFMAEKA